MKEVGGIFVYRDGKVVPVVPGGKRRGRKFTLVSYKTLSIRSFDYPFGSISAIREALKLQYTSVMPGKELEIFPVILKKENRRFSGAALVLPSEERSAVEEGMGNGGKNTPWPLPFALAAELKGNGAAVCVLDDGISSALFVDGEPVVYRWQPVSRKTAEQERDWLLAYGARYGDILFDSIILDVADEGDRLAKGVKDTLEAFPSLGSYSLSRKVLDTAIVMEHLVKGLSSFAWWSIVAGGIFLASGFMRGMTLKTELDRVKERSVEIYREAFGPGNVRDPLSQARGMLAQANRAPDSPAIEDGLRLVATAWPVKQEEDGRISLETLRFGGEGMDLIGTANEVNLVQNLQKALRAETDGNVKLGDIQQVPGGGLRYSLEVRWTAR
nr:type II secretion system protein GspL [uncultured Dethiosulfovibrio sp.]